jgi:hypothetical protein
MKTKVFFNDPIYYQNSIELEISYNYNFSSEPEISKIEILDNNFTDKEKNELLKYFYNNLNEIYNCL